MAQPVTFGSRLRDLRQQSTMTQVELAQRVGISPNTVARLERGEQVPRWETIQRLAAALGVSTEAFRA